MVTVYFRNGEKAVFENVSECFDSSNRLMVQSLEGGYNASFSLDIIAGWSIHFDDKDED